MDHYFYGVGVLVDFLGHDFFPSPSGCAWLYSVGNSLCKNFFKNDQNRTWREQSTSSIFFSWLSMNDIFFEQQVFSMQEFFFKGNFPPFPSPKLKKNGPSLIVPSSLVVTEGKPVLSLTFFPFSFWHTLWLAPDPLQGNLA